MLIKGKAANSFAVLAGFLLLAVGNANANLLSNGGFEADEATGGDQGGATDWTTFESVFTNATDGPQFGPVSAGDGTDPSGSGAGTQSLKMFGPFNGTGSAAGAFQNVAGSAGTIYELSAYVMNWTGDPFGNLGILQLNFLDGAGDPLVGGSEITVDPFGTSDVDLSVIQDGAEVSDWTLLTLSGIAPVGTVEVQAFLLHIQTGDPCCSGGSLFWDDVQLQVVPVPAAVWLFGSALGLLGWMKRRAS
jgi:hypothetical protein